MERKAVSCSLCLLFLVLLSAKARAGEEGRKDYCIIGAGPSGTICAESVYSASCGSFRYNNYS